MPELWMENMPMFITVVIVITSFTIFVMTGKGGDDDDD